MSGSGDKTVRVWDAVSGECVLGPLEGHTSWVSSVSFSGDGSRIVSGFLDKTVRVWDAVSGECVLGPLEGHTSWVTSVSFSGDGSRIVSGSWDKTVRVWDAVSGECVLGPLEGHTDRVSSVSFSGDGSRIVSGSGDKTVRVWDAVSGECVLGPLEGHTRWGEVGVVFWGRVAHRVRVWGQDRAGVGRGVWGVRVGSAGGAHGLGEFGVVFWGRGKTVNAHSKLSTHKIMHVVFFFFSLSVLVFTFIGTTAWWRAHGIMNSAMCLLHMHMRDALKLLAAEASSHIAFRDDGSLLMCSLIMLYSACARSVLGSSFTPMRPRRTRKHSMRSNKNILRIA